MKNHNEHYFSTQATLKPQILMMKSRLSTQWIRWEAGGKQNQLRLLSFMKLNSFQIPLLVPWCSSSEMGSRWAALK